MNNQLKGQRLMALFFVGCLLFNFPLLSLFSTDGMILGIPILYIYVFLAWLAFIGMMSVIIESQ